MTELIVDAQWLPNTVAALEPYHDVLQTAGIERGLIGPRETARLWQRHLFNCAAIADPQLGLVPGEASVIDIGTGAGLPGLVWALVRPDLTVDLVEPLQRRVTFLNETIERLGVADRVRVHNVRAQEVSIHADVVTSRALAPLDDVVRWSTPLVAPGGSIIALKGARAATELAVAREKIPELTADATVVRIGPLQDDGHPWATVVAVHMRSKEDG
jgi:16S rRNA (guanine527-N7)-methyltransferase